MSPKKTGENREQDKMVKILAHLLSNETKYIIEKKQNVEKQIRSRCQIRINKLLLTNTENSSTRRSLQDTGHTRKKSQRVDKIEVN
jgi:BMFP domain-containing protein YqiC